MAKLTLLKLVEIIEIDGNISEIFAYNYFTKNIEFSTKPPWKSENVAIVDDDIIKFKYYLEFVHKMEAPVKLIEESLIIASNKKSYHPVKQYLDKLVWDGNQRIERWLVELCGVEDNQYIRDISRKVLCAAVKRIYEPGCKFDYMLIMEGSQGIGKSTFFNTLAGEWYLDTQLNTNDNKKEIVDIMRTAWIVEIADLAGFRKHEIENLRSFISRKVDRVRLSYARRSEDYARQCIFVGTHNPSGDNEYLKDDTGNRRFWPVVANKIDIQKTKEWRDQLWAEAVVKYKDEILYIDNNDSLKILLNMHKEREIVSPFERKIEEYLINKEMVSNEDIMRIVFKRLPENLSYTEIRSIQTIIGIWMIKNKWVKGENRKRGWYFKTGFQYSDIKEMETNWNE